jgi:uncharacterized protein YbjT (DUF2867 family)
MSMKVLVTGGTGVLGRVGVDRLRFGFFRAKLATERLIEDSRLPWTILRATDFHDLLLMFLIKLSKVPVAVVARGLGSSRWTCATSPTTTVPSRAKMA